MTAGDTEIAARLRAARAYTGLSQEEVARRLGISITTLSKAENGSRPISGGRLREAAEIFKERGVPQSFMEEGFQEEGPAPVERLEAVEHRLQTVSGQVQDLDERIRPTEEQLDAVAVLLPLTLERLEALDGQQSDRRVVEALARARGTKAQEGRGG